MCHREVSLHTACCFLLFFRKSCGSCCLWVGCCVGTVFCAHMFLNLPRQETQTWQRYIICEIKKKWSPLCFLHVGSRLSDNLIVLALCKCNFLNFFVMLRESSHPLLTYFFMNFMFLRSEVSASSHRQVPQRSINWAGTKHNVILIMFIYISEYVKFVLKANLIHKWRHERLLSSWGKF